MIAMLTTLLLTGYCSVLESGEQQTVGAESLGQQNSDREC